MNKGVEMQKKFYITELHFGDDEEDKSNRRRGPGGRRDN